MIENSRRQNPQQVIDQLPTDKYNLNVKQMQILNNVGKKYFTFPTS